MYNLCISFETSEKWRPNMNFKQNSTSQARRQQAVSVSVCWDRSQGTASFDEAATDPKG